MSAIVVEALHKHYGSRAAVSGVSFTVRARETFGLLGPNGAGKTTLVEMLQGLRRPSAGRATVLGLDPFRESKALHYRIGTCLQDTKFPPRLKVGEVVKLFGSVYAGAHEPSGLLRRFGLWDVRSTLCQNLSGGANQRLAVALAFVGDPELVFLDEPSAGLDPATRAILHETIRDGRDGGRTVLLTTHYLEEAAELCDRVAILDRGRIIAAGTIDELRALTVPTIEVAVRWSQPRRDFPFLASAPNLTYFFDADGMGARLKTADPARVITELVRWCDAINLDLTDVDIRRPSLQDVFTIALQKHRIRTE